MEIKIDKENVLHVENGLLNEYCTPRREDGNYHVSKSTIEEYGGMEEFLKQTSSYGSMIVFEE